MWDDVVWGRSVVAGDGWWWWVMGGDGCEGSVNVMVVTWKKCGCEKKIGLSRFFTNQDFLQILVVLTTQINVRPPEMWRMIILHIIFVKTVVVFLPCLPSTYIRASYGNHRYMVHVCTYIISLILEPFGSLFTLDVLVHVVWYYILLHTVRQALAAQHW